MSDDTPNIIKALDDAWNTLGTSRPSVPGGADPLRGGRGGPGWLRFPGRRGQATERRDPAGANELIGALLRLAGGPLAARTLLQALLPGLASRAARGRGRARATRHCAPACDGLDELDQDVVAAAWERITTLAGTSPDWPACTLVEGAWRLSASGQRRPGPVLSQRAAGGCGPDLAIRPPTHQA